MARASCRSFLAAGLLCLASLAQASPCVLDVDVAIIGGGAAGTYAAIRLSEDFGKKVVVIEQKDHLGGHVDTYSLAAPPPYGAIPLDFGVLAYLDRPQTRAWFSKLGVPVTALTVPPYTTSYVDFTTGQTVSNFLPSAADEGTAFGVYYALCAQYASYTVPGGYAGLDYSNPSFPTELLDPFGTFVTNHHLEPLMPIFRQFYPGYINILDVPTAFVMGQFGLPIMQAIAATQQNTAGGFIIPAIHNNSAVYDIALGRLGSSVLLSSTVLNAERTNSGIKLAVTTPKGAQVIKAKKLLFTGVPTIENLAAFDLDSQESGVFSRWDYIKEFAGVVAGTGLPVTNNVQNTYADSSKHYLPIASFVDGFTATTGSSDLFLTRVYASAGDTEASAKLLVKNALLKMLNAGTYTANPNPVFLAFSNHGSSLLHVGYNAIRDNFFPKLFGLQGHRSTFYTGASWTSDYSSLIWEFTDQILANL